MVRPVATASAATWTLSIFVVFVPSNSVIIPERTTTVSPLTRPSASRAASRPSGYVISGVGSARSYGVTPHESASFGARARSVSSRRWESTAGISPISGQCSRTRTRRQSPTPRCRGRGTDPSVRARLSGIPGVWHALFAGFGVLFAALDIADNPVHRLDDTGRVVTDRRLAGEHHGVGTVEDGVGNVRGLCAGRSPRVDHRVEHLRGGDHGRARRVTPADDALLNDRDFFERHLDTEVTAGDHHAVGCLDDLFEVLDGTGAFNLGDDGMSTPRSPSASLIS